MNQRLVNGSENEMVGAHKTRLEPGTLVLFEGWIYKVVGRSGYTIHLRCDDIETVADFWTTTDKVRRLI